eukprot:1175647-Prorocentrum_minimum.AAC.1
MRTVHRLIKIHREAEVNLWTGPKGHQMISSEEEMRTGLKGQTNQPMGSKIPSRAQLHYATSA